MKQHSRLFQELENVSALFSDGDWVESKDQDTSGSVRLIQLADIGDGSFINKSNRFMNIETAKRLNCTFLNKGDILIARMPDPVGRCCIFPFDEHEKYVTVVDIAVLRLKDNCDNSYVKHLINTPQIRHEISIQTTGTTRTRITRKKLGKLRIPLPPLAEQQRIAAILDAADSLRQKDQQLVEHYTALSQSLFLEMFGDPVTNPMGWNIEAFDKLVASDCPLTYGIVQPGDELTEGTAIVRPVDLVERYIKINSLKKIAPEISQKFERTILKGGELLLSVRGSVGAMSIALPELRGANVTRGIVPIWMNTEKMTNEFAINLLQSNQVQKKLKDSSKGATLVQLNLKDLREMQLICPPIVLQKTFTERIQLIEAQKQQALRSLEKSKALFNSLLQRAFTGELTAKMAA